MYGTLEKNVTAVNLEDVLKTLPDKFVVGIDACLGHSASVGKIRYVKEPLRPGAGVDKFLPPVGTCHIAGVVNVGGYMEYFVLQNTRLSVVMRMSDEIVSSIETYFGLKEMKMEA
ncbi:hypothetical protein D3C81_1565720 [compost metagenome]